MSTVRFINYAMLEELDPIPFGARRPFPWTAINQLLTTEAFSTLLSEFPALDWFEKHENMARANYQRPHNRFYLAYERSIYHPNDRNTPGIIKHHELPRSWREFIEELEGDLYRSFISALFGVSRFTVRYAWHISVVGSEVSPHRDAANKAGTHIFYFNTSHDWREEWGGSTLVLDGKRTPLENPEFQDFNTATRVQFLDNRSFLFRNTRDAWHGMQKLLPPGREQRRIFNVIFETEETKRSKSLLAGVRGLLDR